MGRPWGGVGRDLEVWDVGRGIGRPGGTHRGWGGHWGGGGESHV